jgi:hypothetical protein
MHNLQADLQTMAPRYWVMLFLLVYIAFIKNGNY